MSKRSRKKDVERGVMRVSMIRRAMKGNCSNNRIEFLYDNYQPVKIIDISHCLF